MVIAINRWIFGGWGDYFNHVRAGAIENLHELPEVIRSPIFPPKIISWRKKFGGVKNSKSVSTEDYSVAAPKNKKHDVIKVACMHKIFC